MGMPEHGQASFFCLGGLMKLLHSFDFVTQELIYTGELKNPPDGLLHSDFAKRLIRIVQDIPRGSVVGIQGAWGRGKTDILSRLAILANEPSDLISHVFWLNPWQYGTSDLLTPL